MLLTRLIPIVLLSLLMSCAAVTTKPQIKASHTDNVPYTDDGLTYWMPKKDVLVTVTFAKGTTTPTVTVATSSAYADLSQTYVARFDKRNLIGKNKLTMVINEQGLLSSAKSETTSELSSLLSELAGAAGAIGTYALDRMGPPASCPDEAVVTMRVPVSSGNGNKTYQEKDFTTCPVVVRIELAGNAPSGNKRATERKSHSGFFYRQNLPYNVTVTVGNLTGQHLVLLPNDSSTQFLPVDRSLFASNESDLTFTDGVPTKYGQSIDGEALALFKIPAEVLKAYFAAIGTAFSNKSSAMSKESAYLTALTALTKQQLEAEACLSALKSKEQTKIDSICK